jgi:hypothetical protein
MPKYTYTETQMIKDIAKVMAENTGPFTKLMLVDLLHPIYPTKYKQELMNEISMAILTDKKCNNRFAVVRPQVWDLRERVDRGQ